ncbi:MAG: AI-2E family transporter [Thermoleophilia bacterium]
MPENNKENLNSAEAENLGPDRGLLNIRIPRWVQMVGLPVLALFAWFTASALIQVIFIFAAATILSLMINPLVKKLEALKIPRFIGVFIVFLSLLALLVVFFILVIPPTINQLQELVNNLPDYTDTIRQHVGGWKSSLESLNLPFDASNEVDRVIDRLETAAVDLGSLLLAYSINFVSMITTLFLMIVITIYMLLDAKRIGRVVRRFFPPDHQAEADEFVQRSERAVTHWVRAQALLSLLIGISSGLGIWFLGAIGVWPQGAQYSVFFGAWAGLMEFIPYIGPILAAIPPVFLAFFTSPWISLAVILVFVFIQQVEGHVLVPNIMGQAVGVHPLVVIFAVLAGANMFGIPGMLLALPIVALGRELFSFFKPRISLEKWQPPNPGAAAPATEEIVNPDQE